MISALACSPRFKDMAKREHQVKTVNNSFVDAESSGAIQYPSMSRGRERSR
jgi:hypothetical protein